MIATKKASYYNNLYNNTDHNMKSFSSYFGFGKNKSSKQHIIPINSDATIVKDKGDYFLSDAQKQSLQSYAKNNLSKPMPNISILNEKYNNNLATSNEKGKKQQRIHSTSNESTTTTTSSSTNSYNNVDNIKKEKRNSKYKLEKLKDNNSNVSNDISNNLKYTHINSSNGGKILPERSASMKHDIYNNTSGKEVTSAEGKRTKSSIVDNNARLAKESSANIDFSSNPTTNIVKRKHKKNKSHAMLAELNLPDKSNSNSNNNNNNSNNSDYSKVISKYDNAALSSQGSSKVTNIPAASSTAANSNSSNDNNNKKKELCCDKCDGKHETDDCPYYKKKRENHPDAQRSKKHMGGTSTLPGNIIRNGRVVRQPGDGSCLFHSMSYGLPSRSNASKLRSEICSFISHNPNFLICDTPLKDWVKWDSGSSVNEYSRKMSRSSWGGGIEMACCSQIKNVNVHVYERCSSGFKRISAFDYPTSPETKPTVRVVYGGGVHYDALVVG